jgi:hypothetical protein
MRTLLWTVAVMFLARSTVADPAASELDDLLREDGCRGPLSLKMPKAPLGRVFDTVGALNPRCAVRFDVAPDVAVLQASLELKDVKLATVLDVLAGNHDLVYSLAEGKVSVRRKAQADPRTVELEVEVGSDAAPTRPRLTIQVGGCATVKYGRQSGALKIDPATGSLERDEEPTLRAHVCAEKATAKELRFVGDVVLVSSAPDGFRSRADRVIVRQTMASGDKDVSVFRAPDGSVHVTLKGYTLRVTGEGAAPGGAKP